LTATADVRIVTGEVLDLLKSEHRKPVVLSGEQLATALRSEQWRGARDIGELTFIEFRTLILRGLGYALPPLTGAIMLVFWWRRKAKRRGFHESSHSR